MKHVLTSAGILALGAASLQALDPEMTRQQTGRPFSVAATVRGFYDDNVNTSPDKIVTASGVIHPRQDSFGFEVSPSAHLNLPMEQTFISLGYVYSLKWYQDRDPDIDQSHEFSAKLRHQFSPKHQIGVDDSFVLTSEPTVVDRFGIVTAPVRTRSSVFHNVGSIEDNIGLTQLIGLSFGYVNSWYDYEADGAGSRSALLDRIEHSIRGDVRYQFTPKLVGLVGYTFGFSTFTGDEPILSPGDQQAAIDSGLSARKAHQKSNIRDSYSHYIYVGTDYDLTAQLRASVRVGAQITDFHRVSETSISPYADASLTYVYLPGDSVEVGVRHARNATDIGKIDGKGNPTLDAETTAAYLQLNHQITHALTASFIGQYQISSFNDGASDGEDEALALLGVNLGYRINRHWSTELGYNYDWLMSDLKGREYDRNRVYIGVRAQY